MNNEPGLYLGFCDFLLVIGRWLRFMDQEDCGIRICPKNRSICSLAADIWEMDAGEYRIDEVKKGGIMGWSHLRS